MPAERRRRRRSTRRPTTSTTASARARRSWSRSPGSTRRRRSRRPAPVADQPTSAATPTSNAPVVVIDAKTGKRWPIWVEIDSQRDRPENTALLIHPARNFASGHRYIVALRNLKTRPAASSPAPEGFRYYRDELPARSSRRSRRSASASRRSSATLRKAGDRARNLYLAWDFTVASDENIAGAAAPHARRRVRAARRHRTSPTVQVQGGAPAFTVDRRSRTSRTGAGPEHGPRGDRDVRGARATWRPNCEPRRPLRARRERRLPSQNGTWTGELRLHRSRTRRRRPGAAARPARRSTATGCSARRREVDLGPAADPRADATTSSSARPTRSGCRAATSRTRSAILQDLGELPGARPTASSRGCSTSCYLGPADDQPERVRSPTPPSTSDGADTGSPPVLDTSHLYYNGNSQGGILGGALTAVSPDFTRASLGVPAMNYSVLLPRSVDFDPYATILVPGLPGRARRGRWRCR